MQQKKLTPRCNMAKIQTIGAGKYIRNPRGIKGHNSGGMNVEVLQIAVNQGGSYLCYPVTNTETNPVTVDTTRYYQIPIDTEVQQVTI